MASFSSPVNEEIINRSTWSYSEFSNFRNRTSAAEPDHLNSDRPRTNRQKAEGKSDLNASFVLKALLLI